MVYGGYIYRIHGGYKLVYNLKTPFCINPGLTHDIPMGVSPLENPSASWNRLEDGLYAGQIGGSANARVQLGCNPGEPRHSYFVGYPGVLLDNLDISGIVHWIMG